MIIIIIIIIYIFVYPRLLPSRRHRRTRYGLYSICSFSQTCCGIGIDYTVYFTTHTHTAHSYAAQRTRTHKIYSHTRACTYRVHTPRAHTHTVARARI